MWSDKAVQGVVEQAIAETRVHILLKAADWHKNEARKEENVLTNTTGQAGSLRTMFAHQNSEKFFRDLAAGKVKKPISEENMGTVRRWLHRHGLDNHDVF